VFFASQSKSWGPGRLLVRTAGQLFDFEFDPNASTKTLQDRTPAEQK
jgi:hypothetical protein